MASAIAPVGAAIPDRIAYLEGSVLAAWEALDGHAQRFHDTREELTRIQTRLQQLSDAVQVLAGSVHVDHGEG